MPVAIDVESSGLGAFIRSVRKYLDWRYKDPIDIPLDPMMDLFFAQHNIPLSETIGRDTKFVKPLEFLKMYVSDIPEPLMSNYNRGLITGGTLITELIMRSPRV